MADMNGKTPEQIAAEIMQAAKTPVLIEINGVAGQNLTALLKYKHARQIYSKGEKWFNDNLEFLRTELIESVIESQYDQRKKQDAATAEKEKSDYVKLLITRGVNRFQALEMAGLISKEDVEAAQVIEAAKEKAAKDKETAKK
jgi:hypothetical protein